MIARTRAVYFFVFAFTTFLLDETGLALIQWALFMLFIIEAFDYAMFEGLFGAFTRKHY